MGDRESEAIFKSLKLDPQLFINEAFNLVADLVDGAFDFYNEEASTLVKAEGKKDRAEDLSKGIAHICNMTQAVLDKQLHKWEDYCLEHCFVVPEGFEIPQADGSSGDWLTDQDGLTDPLVDAEMDSLRDKLTMAGKECADLSRELQELERQSAKSNRLADPIYEISQLYEQESVHETFQEITRSASELRAKMENLKRKMREDVERESLGEMYNPNTNLPAIKRISKGLSSAELEDIRGFSAL